MTWYIRSNIPLRLQEFPPASPSGTSSGGGVYFTVYPSSCPNTDTVSQSYPSIPVSQSYTTIPCLLPFSCTACLPALLPSFSCTEALPFSCPFPALPWPFSCHIPAVKQVLLRESGDRPGPGPAWPLNALLNTATTIIFCSVSLRWEELKVKFGKRSLLRRQPAFFPFSAKSP